VRHDDNRDQLITISGSDFLVSDARGDVEPGDEPNGLFVRDMRHLSVWRLLVDGEPLRLLTSRNVSHDHARCYLTPGSTRIGQDARVWARRERWVGGGFREEIVLRNETRERQRARVEVQYACDFADLFEVKALRPKRGRTHVEQTPRGVRLRYERDGFWRSTEVALEPAPAVVEAGRACLEADLEPGGSWRLTAEVRCAGDGLAPATAAVAEVAAPAGGAGDAAPAPPRRPPRLETDLEVLRRTYRQSLDDLEALRFRPLVDRPWTPPAAGLPWFMALFGRDSLIISYQALPFDASLAAATLQSLAALQATDVDDFRDAEPGKILHELRWGEVARFDELPMSPYYGSHDSTPLFLVLLDEYERWTGDLSLVRRLEGAARAAAGWIERFGDLDGDGLLEYRARSPRGLTNQLWKDSGNSVQFADGRLAEPPIAACEVQGYAYDACLRTARLARVAWADEGLAARLEARAYALRREVNEAFWSEERGHYVLALDGGKRQVDSLTSNTGHLLWSGIVDEERATAAAERLLAPDMFSGWGVRTLSAANTGYNPVGYHNGTVWPHDTAIVAEGLRRYGFREGASHVALGLVEAAGFFDHRLPEVFAGFPRDETGFPVEYPTASRPQGWAAGAPLLALRTLLGLDVAGGRLRAVPHLPPGLLSLRLSGVRVRGAAFDLP
jgi:glycogen debranching enzyme